MNHLDRFAELVVRVGLDLRRGQDLHVDCAVEHARSPGRSPRPPTSTAPGTSPLIRDDVWQLVA